MDLPENCQVCIVLNYTLATTKSWLLELQVFVWLLLCRRQYSLISFAECYLWRYYQNMPVLGAGAGKY